MRGRSNSYHGDSKRVIRNRVSEEEIFQNQQRPERKQDRFTLLIKTPKENFALEKGKFKSPPPMTTPVEKRNHVKFCKFHGEVGHNTDEYMHMKKQIKEMLKAGKLSYLIKELKQNNGKERLRQQRKEKLPGKKSHEGIEGPMIIETDIGGHCIHRMYVDGGSASEILYEHCFNRLLLKIKNHLVPTITPLIGFSGEVIWTIGQIQLLVTIRDEEHSASAWMNFMVVRSPSLYNGIIKRPGVRKLQAVPSTAHQMLKIPVEGGIITLKSSMLVPLECAMVFGPEGSLPVTKPMVEERIKVAINQEHLEQTMIIGSTLTEEGRNRLCNLLQRNLDIFTWKPADMMGVPRHITEHCLNVREGCSTVRQKKRGQATDRIEEIQEEVGKLMEEGVMKEVHYHDWLSNPVMVKKHDQSRRMGVDFKDLNKACLKYGRNLEVYVDDLFIKSRTEDEIARDTEETFKTLREINMKLNPKKCNFGIEEGMFLGYKVSTMGLKVCPDKVDAVLSLSSPKFLKYVQKLNGKLASLNRFLAKSAEKSLPFFKTFKKCTKKSDFHLTAEAEEAFKQIKQLIAELPMLVAPMDKKELIVYLAAEKETASPILMKERETKQKPIYFVSGALRGPEINFRSMEKLMLALVHANFIVERPKEDSLDTPITEEEELPEPWILFTNGLSCTDGSRAGLILSNPEGVEFTYALRFRFDATNSEAEYEALIFGLKIAKQMGVNNLKENVDSRFQAFSIKQVPRSENKKADALSKITSTSFAHLSKQVLVEELKEKSISTMEVLAVVEVGDTWMTLIFNYLTDGTLPTEIKKARAVRRKSWRFLIINGTLYKKSFLGPWLRCVGPLQANYVLREIHEGSCSMHATGPFPERPGKVTIFIVAIHYFTKWIEAKLVATITGNQIKKFRWDNIVCRFGLPGEIISDNEKQFRDNPFKNWCEILCISQHFAYVNHPQTNRIVERENRSLGKGIKAMLDARSKNWIEELPHVLWAHRTMIKSSNEDTPFSLTYGKNEVIPAEIGMPTLRTAELDLV
nr:reverse transcriptase domain-containing protein [Tanacetum cinerariifolium]